MTDDYLVDRARHGDTRAFAILVDRYKTPVYNILCKLVGKHEDAGDLSQETFIQAYKGLQSYRGESKFSTWLYRIATNKGLDWLRRQKNPARNASSLDVEGEDGGSMLDRLSAREPGPEEIYLAGELQERLRREVGALPDHYRAVIILHHYQNLSYREISEILDLPVRTVETRLYRAKAILKEKLQDLTQGGEPNGLPRSQKVLAQLP